MKPRRPHFLPSLTKTFHFKLLSITATVLFAVAAVVVSVHSSSPPASMAERTAAKSADNPRAWGKTSHTAAVRSFFGLVPLAPLAPLAPTVTATKTDALFTDVDGDLQADPGDTLKYTVTIDSSGGDATGVTFNDTVDPNTAFVGGTLRATPVAVDESYSATGNVRISVAAPGVLGNDFAGVPSATITGAPTTFTSANGGDVTLNADGSFTYNPPAGFEGADTFTYTLTNSAGSNSATVTINVSGMIWFINNSASCPCDGRLTNPFNTLASFAAVNNGSGNNPAANDNIFVYESATDYVGPVTLLSGQRFIGQDATASLSSITGLTPPAGSDPLPTTNSANATIVNITTGNAITVASGNTLTGFTGGNSTTDITGTSFGTLTISDVTLNGTGGALNLSTGTLAATFGSISSTNSSTTGISLTGVAGSLTTPTATITNPTGIGISVNTSSATLNFGPTASTGSGGTGVSLLTNTGAITFGSLDISPDQNQKGLLATDNTMTITATSGTIITSATTGSTNAAGVEITRASGTTPLLIALTSVSTTNGTNGIILKNTSGSFSIIGDNANTSQGGNASGGTISNMSGADGTTADDGASNGIGVGIYLNNATNVSLRRMTVTTTSNFGLEVENTNGLTVQYCRFNGTQGDNTGQGEGAARFLQMTGTVTIDNCEMTGSKANDVRLDNNSGTLSDFIVSNSSLHDNDNLVGNDGIAIDLEGTATIDTHLTGNSLSNHLGDHIDVSTTDTANADVVITGNTCTGTRPAAPASPGDLGRGIRIFSSAFNSPALIRYDISNNNMTGTVQGGAIHVTAGGPGTGTYTGQITNNIIGTTGVNGSGASQSDGIVVEQNGNGAHNVAITNNTIRQYFQVGINTNVTTPGTTGTMDATITGNTVTEHATTASTQPGVLLNSGNTSGPPPSANAVCYDLRTNTIGGAGTNSGIGSEDFRVRQRFSTTVRLPGATAVDLATTATIVLFLQNQNTGVETGSATTQAPGSFVGGGPCNSPSVPTIPSPIDNLAASKVAESAHSPIDDSSKEANLWAPLGERLDVDKVGKLTQAELMWMVRVGIERWRTSGISAEDMARLEAATFEIADLPKGQIASASESGITIDEKAAGYGWYIDQAPMEDSEFDVPVPGNELQTTEYSPAFGRMDLLTVVMRQLGHVYKQGKKSVIKGLRPLMQNTLSPAVRRLPDSRNIQLPSSAVGVSGRNQSGSSKLPLAQLSKASALRLTTGVSRSEVSIRKAGSNARANKADDQGSRLMHHAPRSRAMAASLSMLADVSLNIGTLPAGESITITFNVTVDNPFTGAVAQVSNQGTVSGTNFSDVLTDDPSVGGTADPTVTPIQLQADLAVTKTDSPDPVIAGNNITYTINFINNGPNPSGATVTDATPAGTTFVSAAVTTGTGWSTVNPGVGNTGNVVFSKGSVASGETAVFEVVVKVGSGVPGATIITNNAVAANTGGPTDPVPANNTGTATTTVIAQADLSITKTDGATTEVPGTSVTYTIVATNSGPSDANGVSVVDTFPGTLTGVTYNSVAAGGATGNTAAGAGNIGDTLNMPAGSSVTYTVNATIASSATGNLTNTATVTAPVGVTDPNLANNSATDTDTLTPQADLSITKTDGAASEVPGTSVTYTIVATNNGPSDANGVSVADTFPGILTGVTFNSVAAGGATGNTAAGAGNINDSLNMPAGSSVTYTVTATISASATGNLVNTATVTAPGGVTDPTPGNNSATDTDTLTPQADLSITKTDGAANEVPGTPVTYTITVTNNGPSDASGVSVGDTFPGILSGVTFTSVAAGGATGNTNGAGNISNTLNMPTGSSVTYTATGNIAASATGNLSNTATVTAPGGVTDPTSGNNSATDTDTLTPSADVTVTKTDSPDPVIAGNNITYTITLNNNGPSDAVSLSLSDAVPANTTFVSATTAAGWTRTDAVPVGGTGTLTFTRPSLATGVSSIFTVVVKVNAGTLNGTTITNTANVASATADPTPGNNSANATTLVQNGADLAINKTVAPTGPNGAGSNVTYTIVVTNNGPSPANSVTFTDVVPAGTGRVSQSNPAGWTCNTIPAGSNGTITCTKSSMANGETATLTVVASINCNVPNNAVISNTATVGATSPVDTNTANNTSTKMFTVSNPAPVVTASVTTTQLPQNSHDLINVGLSASATDGPCGAVTVTVQVFGDEDDQTPTGANEVFSPDAKNIAVGTLRLRGERVASANGRVYLIVVKATDAAGQVGFKTLTVTVSKSNSNQDTNSVLAQAAAAKAFADANNGAPPAGYFVIGDGPIIGNKQ